MLLFTRLLELTGAEFDGIVEKGAKSAHTVIYVRRTRPHARVLIRLPCGRF